MQDGGGGPCMMYARRWRWAVYDACRIVEVDSDVCRTVEVGRV